MVCSTSGSSSSMLSAVGPPDGKASGGPVSSRTPYLVENVVRNYSSRNSWNHHPQP